MKQRNPDWMEMYRDVSETERIYIYWTPWSLGKKAQGHLLKVGRRWRGRAERSGNDINHQLKEKFLRKSEHTTKAGDNECIMTLGQSWIFISRT